MIARIDCVMRYNTTGFLGGYRDEQDDRTAWKEAGDRGCWRR